MCNLLQCLMTLAGPSVCCAVPPEFEVLRLPDAVSLSGVGHNNDDTEPFERLQAKVSWRWTAGRQETFEGDLGFLPRTVVHGEENLSLRIEVHRESGRKDNWFTITGMSVLDPLVSPICWIKLADRARERSDLNVRVSGTDVATSFRIDLGDYGVQYVDLTWNGTDEELAVKSGRSTKGRTEYVYRNWKPLPDGSRHPALINVVYPMEPQPLRKTVVLESIQLHGADAPHVPLFSERVRIYDETTGTTLDGKLRPVNAGSASNDSTSGGGTGAAPTKPPGQRFWRVERALAACSALIGLALAIALWKLWR